MADITVNRRQLVERLVQFTTEDGLRLNLVNVRGDREPVILVHGAGVRSNIFCAPVRVVPGTAQGR